MADGSLFGDLRRPVIIDLFCGIGGTAEGVRAALGRSPDASVNHSPYAIAMHSRNHPATLHYQEDVFAVKPWQAARGRPVRLLVGTAPCTHFSVAKGAAPKDDGIRCLSDVFVKWAREIRPNVIILENVREFADWGPLDDAGRPIKERKGEDFRRWVGQLEAEGYRVEWRLLRACDYGAPTSRLRLFLVARCDGEAIRWPAPTHGGEGQPPHRTAAECIDWSIPCPSIFGRSRPLAEATMRRIAAGIHKFVLNNPRPFLLQLSHGGRLEPIDQPMRTVTAGPAGGDRALVTAFLAKHYTGVVGTRLDQPIGTVTTVDHHSLVYAFLQKYYGSDGQNQPVDRPLDTATVKARFGLVTVQVQGEEYAVVDIGMRMLQPRELARAQGFSDSYILEGSKADQIAGIGNSVCPPVAAALVAANVQV